MCLHLHTKACKVKSLPMQESDLFTSNANGTNDHHTSHLLSLCLKKKESREFSY